MEPLEYGKIPHFIFMVDPSESASFYEGTYSDLFAMCNQAKITLNAGVRRDRT